MKNLKNIEYFGQIMYARRMANTTIETYKCCIKNLSKYYNEDLSKITNEQIRQFLIHRVLVLKMSFSDENQHINAIKLFYRTIYNKYIKAEFVKRPKQKQYIPDILTPKEVNQVIWNTQNIKHKCILFCIYNNGLRIGELLNLTLMDVRTKGVDKPFILIRNAKGHKARKLYLTKQCEDLIREYYCTHKPTPKYYLFEGQNHTQPYTSTSIRNILKAALKREGIKKRVRVHDLRHAFATHCIISGTSLAHLAPHLGHSSIKTLEKTYNHLKYDDLDIKRPTHHQTPVLKLKRA